MTDCLFCKIVQKAIPAKIVHEDDRTASTMSTRSACHTLIIPSMGGAGLPRSGLRPLAQL